MSVQKDRFGVLPDGRKIYRYTLKNRNGISAEILTFGCRIYRLFVPNRNGKSENVVLGHKTLAEYNRDDDFFGAVVGRCANRISGAEFQMGGKTYHLAKNEGRNSLHSAPGGYQSRVWNAEAVDESDISPAVTLSCLDRDVECGFPGNVTVKVTYSLSSDNALTICYRAESDQETPFMPTNHTFFNLTGSGKSILPLTLKIHSESITETDQELIPTGKFLPVSGTPFDFRIAKPIGRDISADDPFLRTVGGYDNNFVLTGTPHTFKEAAELYDHESGRKMRVLTDMPGLQVFTANSYHESALNYDGSDMQSYHAVCLETQFFPDSIHRPEFPFETLKPGSAFQSITAYQFSAE
jgi:aldose 1-epimerase